MATKYFKSSDVKVFPCTYRDKLFDPESRLNTEANFALLNRYGSGYNHDCYIVSWDDENENVLKAVLGGYYFEIKTIDYNLTNAINADTCLFIKLVEKNLVGDATTKVLENIHNKSTTENKNYNCLDIDIDGTSFFVGLAFDTEFNYTDTNNYDYCLPIYRNSQKYKGSFLPRISSLPDDYEGILVKDLEVYDFDKSKTYSNSTARWLNRHILSSNPGLTVGVSRGTSSKSDYVVDFELDLDNKKALSNTYPAKSDNIYGYFPVAVAEYSKLNDSNVLEDKTALVVGVPDINSWRPINIYGKNNEIVHRISPEYGEANSLDLVPGTNVNFEFNPVTNKFTINSSDRYIRSLATNGLMLGMVADTDNVLYAPYATKAKPGVVKTFDQIDTEAQIETVNNSNRIYGVSIDSSQRLFVNVPWINYSDRLEDIERRLIELENGGGGGGEVDDPWTSTPTIEIYNSENHKIDGSTGYLYPLVDELSTYTGKVFHNKDLGYLVDITGSSKKGTTNIIWDSTSSTNNFWGFKISPKTNLNIGELIEDTLEFTIKYLDTSGAVKASKRVEYQIAYNFDAIDLPLPYTDFPTIELYDYAKGDTVKESYEFKRIEDVGFKINHNENSEYSAYIYRESFNFVYYSSDGKTYKSYSTGLTRDDEASGSTYDIYKISNDLLENYPSGRSKVYVDFSLNFISEDDAVVRPMEISLKSAVATIVPPVIRPTKYYDGVPTVELRTMDNSSTIIPNISYSVTELEEDTGWSYETGEVVRYIDSYIRINPRGSSANGISISSNDVIVEEFITRIGFSVEYAAADCIDIKVSNVGYPGKPGTSVHAVCPITIRYNHTESNTSETVKLEVELHYVYPTDPGSEE